LIRQGEIAVQAVVLFVSSLKNADPWVRAGGARCPWDLAKERFIRRPIVSILLIGERSRYI